VLKLIEKYKCPKCSGCVHKATIKGYYAQCIECDEDFYKFELALRIGETK
jgi:hypothetical protein